MADNDNQEKAMERIKAITTKYFDEHIIIVRSNDAEGRFMLWSYSDPQWAQGAMSRVERVIKELQP